MHLEHLKMEMYSKKFHLKTKRWPERQRFTYDISRGYSGHEKSLKSSLGYPLLYAKFVVEMWFILFLVIFFHSPIKKITGHSSNDLFRAQNRCCIFVKKCPPGIAPFDEICRLSKKKEEITSFIILN